jgi:hypothetical protein
MPYEILDVVLFRKMSLDSKRMILSLELDEEEEEAVMAAAVEEEEREEEQQHWMLRLESKSPYGFKTVPMLS